MTSLGTTRPTNAEQICSSRELVASASPKPALCAAEGGIQNGVIRSDVEVRRATQMNGAERIQAGLPYMLKQLDKPMKVSQLSAMVGLSESTFFVLFKHATGRTPLDFFRHARMQRATGLLAETTMQVKAVAASVGYEDPFYFSRVFKSVHGISPSEYRTRQAESSRRDLSQAFSTTNTQHRKSNTNQNPKRKYP